MNIDHLGERHARCAELPRERIGGCWCDDDNEYDLVLLDMHTPAVESLRTGRLFALPWRDLVDLARAAGIDEQEDR
jgi:hypothetical protein